MKKPKVTPCVLLFAVLPWGIFAQNGQAEQAFTDVPLWRQALGGAVIGRPVAQVESVVMATDGGNLVSFSSQGRRLWNFFARGRLTPYISRSREGTSYIGRTDGLLIAVNRAGRELWQFSAGGPLVSPVLIGWDGRLFVFTERRITCLTASGYVLWTRTLDAENALPPMLGACGGVILVQENGDVLRIDPFGTVFSRPSTAVPQAAAPLRLEDSRPAILLFYGDRRVELIHNFTTGEAVTGTLNFPSPPVAAAGRGSEAAVLLRDGRVALVAPRESPDAVRRTAPAEKEIRWIAESHISAGEIPARPGPLELEIFFNERGIYVLTGTGATGFLADSRRLWFVRLRGAASVPSFGDDGILYSGGTDWILNAYRLEDYVRAGQSLLYGPLPEGDYGTGNPGPSRWANYFFRFEEQAMAARFHEIREAVRYGEVGAREKEFKAWLMETAGSLLPNPLHRRSQSSRLPDLRHRIEAARLLGYIGSRETIPFLTDLFNRDPEPLVRAAAAGAIGRIGVDPQGIALRAFSNAISPPSPARDEALLVSVAWAIGALCRFSGPPLSSTGVRLLVALAGYYDIPLAQRQARAEIRSLIR
ncbi:MAG: PQQ-binding-like beta-propeller repeat protein [Treponema sp.]|nr:PQQ-binding-like beta-propeller repeat protein [Treponema sp.]